MAFDDPLKDLDFEQRQPVIDMLEAGESVLWAGRPGRVGTRRHLVPMVAGIGWLGIVTWAFWLRGPDNPAWYVGIPFLLAGLFVFAAPLRKRRRLGRRLYVLTNRRAVVFEPGRRHAIPLRPGSRVRQTRHAGAGGDIWFEDQEEMESVRITPEGTRPARTHPKARRFIKIGFTHLPNPDKPFALIQDIVHP